MFPRRIILGQYHDDAKKIPEYRNKSSTWIPREAYFFQKESIRNPSRNILGRPRTNFPRLRVNVPYERNPMGFYDEFISSYANPRIFPRRKRSAGIS